MCACRWRLHPFLEDMLRRTRLLPWLQRRQWEHDTALVERLAAALPQAVPATSRSPPAAPVLKGARTPRPCRPPLLNPRLCALWLAGDSARPCAQCSTLPWPCHTPPLAWTWALTWGSC